MVKLHLKQSLEMNRKKLFDDYYNKNFNKLLRYLEYQYPNLYDPENHLQVIFVQFWERYLPNWDETKSALSTYFGNYLNMEILNRIKMQKDNIVSMDKEYDVGGKIVTIKDILSEDTYHNRIDEKMDILNQIIKNMDAKDLVNFETLKFYIDGMEYTQIAEHTGINLSTIKSRIRASRIYICDEYNKITGENIEFKKVKQKNKVKEYLRLKEWRNANRTNKTTHQTERNC